MWAIIPFVHRIGHDIDPIQCMHWRPTESDIPESLKGYYDEQNLAFATKLLSICTVGQRSTFLAEHKFGVKKDTFQADESDGMSIYWTILQLYRPLDRGYRRTLESEINHFHSKFKPGKGNIEKTLEELRLKHREALDIMLRLRWDSCAIPLIDVLCQRDSLFTVKLADFRALPNDPDDSAVEFGALLTDIGGVIDQLNDAKKDWDGGSARIASANQSREFSDLRGEVKNLRALIAKPGGARTYGKPPGKPNGGNPNGSANTPKQGMCQVKGCSAKVLGYTAINQWKVCGTCLLKTRESKQVLNLVDGSTWGGQRKAKAMIALMTDSGVMVKGTKGKAKRASSSKNKRAADPAESDLSEDDVPRNKRAKRAAKANRAKAAKVVAIAPADEIMYY